MRSVPVRFRASALVTAALTAGLALGGLALGGLPAAAAHGLAAPRPGPARAAGAASIAHVALTWRQRASGLTRPVQVTSAHDGSPRLFVVEQRGTIKVFRHGAVRRGTYLDIRGPVNSGGNEQGLLSVVFDPQFRVHHRLWVAYTRADGALVLAVFRAATTRAGHVAANSGRTVLVVRHPVNDNHNGGQLGFGPDGMLYLGTGDGGSGGDPPNNAQNHKVLLGKVLRIDPRHHCGGKRYCVPSDNPFAGKKPGRGEIWLWGVRNPWRWSFDAVTGDLWIGDVGQNAVEEIDHVPASPTVRNLGWSCWEARQHYDTSRCRSGAKYLFPVATVPHPQAEAIIGGFVYRGSKYASLMNGIYLFADDNSGRVWTYRRGQGKRLQAAELPGNPTGFGVDDRNEVWAVTLDGRLWAMRATAS